VTLYLQVCTYVIDLKKIFYKIVAELLTHRVDPYRRAAMALLLAPTLLFNMDSLNKIIQNEIVNNFSHLQLH
jgi:hypothetical protein